jgi:hypothetical protein
VDGLRPRRPRARGSAGSRLTWLPAGLLAAAILLIPEIHGASRDTADPRSPTAYTAIVNDALREMWLRPQVDSQNDGGEISGRVVVTGSAPAPFRTFVSHSFLDQDMRHLDSAVWHYDGDELRLDERAHILRPTYFDDSGWGGDILFFDAREQMLLVDERGETAAALIAPGPGAPPDDAELRLFQQGRIAPAIPSGTRVDFYVPGGEQGIQVADVRVVGDQALVRVVRAEEPVEGLEIRIGRQALSLKQGFQAAWAWLHDGDSISIGLKGQTRRFQFVRTRPLISAARGNAPRARDAALANFAKPVEGAMDADAGSIRTSIRHDIQTEAERLLSQQSRALVRLPGIGSFRSAAVLMDGLTGEIVALPTFPVVTEDLDPRQVNSPRHRRMLERNSNFVRMMAGSTAKPPLAFAILQSFPQLRYLQISASPTFRTLLGVDLGVEVPDHVETGSIGFTDFLARSSNKYALTLMMLGLASPAAFDVPDRSCDERIAESFLIGRQPFRCRPEMPFLKGRRPGPYGSVPPQRRNPAGGAWTGNLAALYCLYPRGPAAAGGIPPAGCLSDDWSGPSIWRGQAFARPAMLASVTPEPEAFGFNAVNSLYADYLMTILGGNRGRWTTIGLAEAYARILTGRAVTARLTPATSAEPPPELTMARTANFGAAQTAVLTGLAAVVQNANATGYRLRGGLPEKAANGDIIRIFAKTGTPNVTRLGNESRARQRLQEFAADGCGLRLVAVRGHLTLAVGNDRGNPASAIRQLSGICGHYTASADLLADEIRRINADPSVLDRVQTGPTGVVTRLPSAVSPEEGLGHALVMMIARYRPGAPVNRPCRLSVAAINIQARLDRSGERTPALDYALQLFANGPVRTWLLSSCPAQRS